MAVACWPPAGQKAANALPYLTKVATNPNGALPVIAYTRSLPGFGDVIDNEKA